MGSCRNGSASDASIVSLAAPTKESLTRSTVSRFARRVRSRSALTATSRPKSPAPKNKFIRDFNQMSHINPFRQK